MSKIVFEPVENNHCLGKRGEFELLIDNENGYVNATKLCSDRGKRYENWRRNKENLKLLENGNVNKKTNALTNLQETYLNTHLIRYMAYWISSDCAIEVNTILDEYLIVKNKEKIDDIINEMAKLSIDNAITHEKLDNVIKDRVVKPINPELTHTIAIYKVERNVFRIFRRQKVSLDYAVSKYPGIVEFYQINYNPNAINFYTRFKEHIKEFKEGNITIKRNIITTTNISDEKFEEYIKQIDDEKYNLDNIQ